MATEWACITCGRGSGTVLLGTTLDPRYRQGYCVACNKPRTFQEVPKLEDGPGSVRATDPPTSFRAAAKIRTGTAKAKLLLAYERDRDGLTDEEAAEEAGLSLLSEYATRCSELQRAGLVEPTPYIRTSPTSGMARQVRKITPAGVGLALQLQRVS